MNRERRLARRQESVRRRPAAYAARAIVLVAAAVLTACSSAPPPSVPAARLSPLAAELLPPSTGYPLTADESFLRALDAAFERLRRGDSSARHDAETRLAGDPGFHPATVLLAEADLLADDAASALERLRPIVAELPAYDAAQIALATAAEQLGDLPVALAAFSAAAPRVAGAAAKAREVRPRALEIARHRLEDALARGRLPDAEAQLGFLQRWAADDEPTWEATRAVAAAAHDPRRELMAVRRLAAFPGAERDLKESLARLEIETGDAAAGVRVYEELVRQNPGDPGLAEKLGWAKYRFRLQLLPANVRTIAERPQLTRASFAALLYWLSPDVRYGRGGSVRIATDILETEHRDEIMRVLNLGLFDVDETLHRFYPDNAITRGDALAALLRLLAGRGRVGCVNGLSTQTIARDTACGLAVSCGLERDPSGCIAGAPLSGADAADLIQRALELSPAR